MAGKGGKRPGAGRKPGSRTAAQQKAIDIAGTVLAKIDAEATWIALLKCGDPKVIQTTMIYLTNRVHGMPTQPIAGDRENPLVPSRLILVDAGAPEPKKD